MYSTICSQKFREYNKGFCVSILDLLEGEQILSKCSSCSWGACKNASKCLWPWVKGLFYAYAFEQLLVLYRTFLSISKLKLLLTGLALAYRWLLVFYAYGPINLLLGTQSNFDAYFNLSLIYYFNVLKFCQNFTWRKIFSSKIILCHFVSSANWEFESQKFYLIICAFLPWTNLYTLQLTMGHMPFFQAHNKMVIIITQTCLRVYKMVLSWLPNCYITW